MKMKKYLLWIIAIICVTFIATLIGCAVEHKVSIEVVPEDGGTVGGDGVYSDEEHVILDATPGEGFAFKGWEEYGEIVTTNSTYEFEIVEDRFLRAIFEEEAEVEVMDYPDEIEKWIENSRDIKLSQAREYEGTLYLLATYGRRETKGYDVEITEVIEKDEELQVKVNYMEPTEEEEIPTDPYYPYDLKTLEPVDLPVKFVTEFVPTLFGIDYIPPIVAESEDIKVFAPEPESTVSKSFQVEGIEHVFEGTVNYRIYDNEGEELESGHTGGHGYQWGYFEVDLLLPQEIEHGENFLVTLYSQCPKEGIEENVVELPLTLE